MHARFLNSNPSLPVRCVAAVLALAAGLIHFGVAPTHFREAREFGLFMVVAGAAQLAAGILLVVWPSRVVMLATVLGTLCLLGVFAVAYTVGLPVGPDAGNPESIGPVVIVSKLLEGALLLALILPLGRTDVARACGATST